jgi:hypothetical protein
MPSHVHNTAIAFLLAHHAHACCAQVGLEKLLAAEGEVNVMKQELIDLQPKLIETGKRAGKSIGTVAGLSTMQAY